MISSNVLHNVTTMAPSFPHHSNQNGCIWSQITKLDNISIQRPINIEGTSIPIQEYSIILRQTDMQGCESLSNAYGNEHFRYMSEISRDQTFFHSDMITPVQSKVEDDKGNYHVFIDPTSSHYVHKNAKHKIWTHQLIHKAFWKLVSYISLH